jgi:TonB family protein
MDAAGPPPIRVGTNIAMPDRIIYVEPEIPFQARRKEALGAVALNVLLSSDGKVQSITITESVPLINEAVLQAVKQWQYKPTIYNGIAVPVVVPVRYNYIGVPIPKELVAQLKGSNAKFESSSLLTGSISNPTTWTVGVVRLMFKGPRDEKLPVKWERTCDSYIVIEPGASADFRCDLSGVDHSQSSRWYWTEAWGLPPP